ncbi:MAG: glycerol-3-phosphate dehydrogenase/oxidase [Candidatus Margulisiibacteriota bacterium]|nr:glycerol-3-phosphate dehydrogenase/oxidase [Candidatus Margulisiibacteriota bacterium]
MIPHNLHYDLAVVGGGITGAGVAYDAICRGLSVALFEQHDFGVGASTATSKLAHGGLRYLEQLQFKLVSESLNERNFLLSSAPHLVKPLQFYVPLYKHSKWKPWQLSIGLKVYDLLQNKSILPNHEMLQVKRLENDVPWLKTNGMIGCGSYFDAQMDDHRLIVETLLMAESEGAIIKNYSKVANIDEMSKGVSFDVESRHATNSYSTSSMIIATGAWNNSLSNRSIVKPSKGIHIVLPDMDLSAALLLMTPQDDRVFFVMPWEGRTLVGTTETPDDGCYSAPNVLSGEAQYLLDALNHYSNNRLWELSDIQSVFCGYRPLISTTEKSLSKQTREESYDWIKSGVLAVSGGKYTTYRQMAKKAVNKIVKEQFSNRSILNSNQTLPFVGAIQNNEWPSESQLNQLHDRYGVQRESILHLIDTYGLLYKDILNTISFHPESSVRFDIAFPMIIAELKYAIKKEWVKTPADFLLRRTYYGYLYRDQPDLLNAIIQQFYYLTNQDEFNLGVELEKITQKVGLK